MFPKIRVCHNSMHSKRKVSKLFVIIVKYISIYEVNQYYPDVTDDLIMRLYGLDIQLNDGEYVS